MQEERIEIIKLFCYVVFLFLFLIIGNFVGQEFINRDDHVHRMMYVIMNILCLSTIYCIINYTT